MTPERNLIAAIIQAEGAPLIAGDVDAILTTPAVQAALAKVRGEIDAKRIKSAADGVLAPLCAEVGRYLYEMPDADMVQVMHEYGVTITAAAFKELYDATDFDPATPKPEPVYDAMAYAKSIVEAVEQGCTYEAKVLAVRDWLKRAGCV